MLELADSALQVANTLAQKTLQGHELSDFELHLYEASSRLATTLLKIQERCSQSALIKAERELDDLCEPEETADRCGTQ